MQKVKNNFMNWSLIPLVSLIFLTLSASWVSAEMARMSEDELSEVSGKASASVSSVHENAKDFNLYEKIGTSSNAFQEALKDKFREQYSNRLSSELLNDNKVMNHFTKTFVTETVSTMRTTGKNPVSVTDRGSLKLSSQLSKNLFKTAITQSLGTFLNPGRIIPESSNP